MARLSRTTLLALMGCFAGLFAAGSAGAATTASVDPVRGALVIADDAADPNDLTVTKSGSAAETWLIYEKGDLILTPEAGCAYADTTQKKLTCAAPAGGFALIDADLGGGNDVIAVGGIARTLVPVTVDGGAGDDKLFGSDGEDQLHGDTGNDFLDGGRGQDLLDGGDGSGDLASYANRSDAIIVDLRGTTGQGAADENDTITDSVEGVIGGSGDDVLIGDEKANALAGGKTDGTSATGNDTLIGHGEADSFHGLTGNDQIDAADGVRDALIDCGADADSVLLDTSDSGLSTNCEVQDTDTDLDGEGDSVDADDDGDGVSDANDGCAGTPLATQVASDGCSDPDADGISTDAGDNCPDTTNADQADSDGDTQGDACDADGDGDGVSDANDGCAGTPLATQVASDGCSDPDADGISTDAGDNCPDTTNSDQADVDGDGKGDTCDDKDDRVVAEPTRDDPAAEQRNPPAEQQDSPAEQQDSPAEQQDSPADRRVPFDRHRPATDEVSQGGKHKGYRYYCQGFSKKRIKGDKGTPFKRCVKALKKINKAKRIEKRTGKKIKSACGRQKLSRKRRKGQGMSDLRACRQAGRALVKDKRAA